ncbi:transglycosylase SLT domain-containing protein [Streptomyces sp. 796.1]|uniref:transglycosylase SLT domain-containing protein n=1 Tax=Streptomyces sp. 796.1 TaxID=3163029 RepID=UPI0039C8CCDC
MATLTHLGFSIFSRYDGAGVLRARRDLRRLNSRLQDNEKALLATSKRFGGLRTAALSLAPALIPIGTVAAGVGAATVGMAVTAGAGFAMYGAMVKHQIEAVHKMRDAHSKLSQTQQSYLKSEDKVSDALRRVSRATRDATLAPIIPVLNGAAKAAGLVAPVFKLVSREMRVLGVATGDWLTDADGFRRFMGLIKSVGVPAMRDLIKAGRDIAAVLGFGFRASTPFVSSLTGALVQGAAAARRWAEGGGFTRFFALVRSQGPSVGEFFRLLVQVLGHVGTAMAGLGPLALGLATALLRIIAALPIPVLQTIIILFYAWKAAILGLMVIRTIVTLITMLKMAWATLNLVWAASPIGIVTLAIIALVGAVVLIATKTTWFQTIWAHTWSGVRTAFSATWAFIKGLALTVWGFLGGKWKWLILLIGPVGWLLLLAANWRAVWGGIRAFALLVWGAMRTAWAAGCVAMRAAWTFLGRVARAVWVSMIRPALIAVRVLLGGVRASFRVVGAACRAAWSLLGRVVRAVWLTTIRVAFVAVRMLLGGVRTSFRVVGAACRAAWSFLGRVVRAVWANTIRVAFTAVRVLLGGVRSSFRAVSAACRVAWSLLGRAVRRIWNDAIRPAFNAVRGGLRTVRKAFETAVRGIDQAWSKLRGVTKSPVKFFVNTVYNDGLRRAWNSTAGKIPGVPDLPKAKLGFRSGGEIPGSGSGGDRVPIMAQAGEYVIRRSRVRELGTKTLDWLNGGSGKSALNHFGPQRRPGFFLGGAIPNPVDVIKDAGKAAAGFVTDPVGQVFDWAGGIFRSLAGRAMKALFTPYRKLVGGLAKDERGKSGVVSTAIKENANRGFDALIDFVMSKATDDSGNGYIPWKGWKAGDGKRVGFRGVTVNVRTRAMLLNAERLARRRFSYAQGSYSNAKASAGTHTGGGAVDLNPASNSIVGNMRASGFAAWARSRKEGFSPHIHGIAVGDPTASGAAKSQVKDFFQGLNGLANKGPDTYQGGPGGSGVNRWRGLALQALRLGGVNVNQIGRFMALMAAESGGNPRAINRSDSNARRGDPSRGLMQLIMATFRANHVAGTSNNIFDPLANMAASARYIKRRYGGKVPGSPYHLGGLVNSFDQGGFLPTGLSLAFNGTGRPEPVGHDLVPRGRGEGDCTHVHIHGNVYAKSEREFEQMLAGAMQNLKRKGRLPK